MANKPTTLSELLGYDFLAQRLFGMRKCIAINPTTTALWIGAGYSANLANLPTWRTFLLDCLKYVDEGRESEVIKSIIAAGRLQLAAEYLNQLLGDQLTRRIESTFTKTVVSKEPIISRYCATKILTTNYDTLLENSMKWYEVKTPLDSIDSLLSPSFNLVKLHGSADNPSTCVLSISSYAKTYNRDFEWYLINTFLTNTVMFIGASMDQSELFFRSIATIRKYKKDHPKHYAVVAVESDAYGTRLGKTLEGFGIELIPYIPGENHHLLDEILSFISPGKWSRANLNSRLALLRRLLQEKRYLEIATFLHYMCQEEIEDNQKRAFGDVINRFLVALLSEPNSEEVLLKLKKAGLNVSSIIIAAGDLIDEASSAFDGLIIGLKKLEEIEKENYQIHISRLQKRKGRVNHDRL